MFTAIKDFVLKDIVLEVKNLRSINHLNQLHDSYLPWSGASIQPTALVFLLNDIMINNRKIMVECGAGISTIYVAALMKQLGDKSRKLYSIDHDKNWLSILEKELESQSLKNQVKLIHAPLKHSSYCLNEDYTWYDTEVLDEVAPKKDIDLLFIDGPPANKKGIEKSRYPALPYFRDKLSENFLVILDDATRKGEAFIANKWSTENNLSFKKSILEGNIFIGRKGSSYNVL